MHVVHACLACILRVVPSPILSKRPLLQCALQSTPAGLTSGCRRNARLHGLPRLLYIYPDHEACTLHAQHTLVPSDSNSRSRVGASAVLRDMHARPLTDRCYVPGPTHVPSPCLNIFNLCCIGKQAMHAHASSGLYPGCLYLQGHRCSASASAAPVYSITTARAPLELPASEDLSPSRRIGCN